MKALQRIAATMAALGISVPDARMLGRMSKHSFNKTGHQAGKRSTCRLKIAQGPGSISAKAEITQLCNQGRFNEAHIYAESHEVQCGERLFPTAWWRNCKEDTP